MYYISVLDMGPIVAVSRYQEHFTEILWQYVFGILNTLSEF